MQIHFKTKEDAIAYLEQMNAELEERSILLEAEREDLQRELKGKLEEERKSRKWWKRLLFGEDIFACAVECRLISKASDKIANLQQTILNNEEYIKKIMEAENAEGFTIEV